MGNMSKRHIDQPEHPASYLISANSMQAPLPHWVQGGWRGQVMLLEGCSERGKAVAALFVLQPCLDRGLPVAAAP